MRITRFATVAAVSAALGGASPAALVAQSPAFEAAVNALGGRDRIMAVRTLAIEGRGEQLNFGQNLSPTADTKFEVTSYKWLTDFPNKRHLIDVTREPRFVTAVTTPQRIRLGLDGDVAYGVLPNGGMTRAPAQAAADRAHNLLMLPIGFVQAAAAPGVEITESAASGGMRAVTLNMGGNRYVMVVDPSTNLPVRVEKMVDQAMLGDVALIMDFADWQEIGGIRMPMRMTQRYENLFTLSDIRLTGARVNEDLGTLTATDSIRAAVPAPAPPPTITVEELSPGVWWIGGQTHHTIAIEQSNRIVLVEAPQSDARALAAIEAARALRPGKPVNFLINTHHHFDHAGGLRAAISQGLTVMTHEGNKNFYERVVFPRRHSIIPDSLAKHPRPLRVVAVGDRQQLKDDLRTIQVFHVSGNPHNANMLAVYLPAEKILIQADLYNPPTPGAPPPPSFPFAANLVEHVTRRALQVDRVVGIHGRPVPYSEVQAAAAASATRAP